MEAFTMIDAFPSRGELCTIGPLRNIMHRLARARVAPGVLRRRARILFAVHLCALLIGVVAFAALRLAENQSLQLIGLFALLAAALVFALALIGWPFMFADAFLREYVAAMEANCEALEAAEERARLEQEILAIQLDATANTLREQLGSLQREVREHQHERELIPA
jgi:hypothetical protein